MPTNNLLERTRELLACRPRNISVEQIAQATGLKASWINDLAWGRSTNPGVKGVQTLYEHLAGKPLNLED